MRTSYWKRALGFFFCVVVQKSIKLSLNFCCTVLVIILKKGETSKSISCVSPPPSLGCTEKAIQANCGFPPISWIEEGVKQCVHQSDTDGGCCAPLMGQQSDPTGSGQQEQWQSRAIRAKTSTDCATALTAIHILRRTDPLYSKNRASAFPLYIHTKSHLSLTPQWNSPTEQTGQ